MRRWCWRWALLLALASGVAPAWADNAVAVIVAAGAPPLNLGSDELALIYLRKRLFVAGARVQPINLPLTHPLRRWFSQHLLRQTPEELENYWRDQYFNGIVPPFVLASEEAVIRFVASTPGAIGYVPACLVDRRVSVILQLDGGPACPR